MTDIERSNITNGIWLCRNCAKEIDNHPEYYTSDLLEEWKNFRDAAFFDDDAHVQAKQSGRPLLATAIELSRRPSQVYELAVFDEVKNIDDTPGGSEAAFRWAMEHNAVPAGQSEVLLVLEGLPGATTTITNISLKVVSRCPSAPGYYLISENAGADGTIRLAFDLDEPGCPARGQNWDEPSRLYFDGSRVITLKDAESQSIHLVANARSGDVSWLIELDAVRMGIRTTVVVVPQTGGAFRTIAFGARVPTVWVAWWVGSHRFVVDPPGGRRIIVI